MMNDEQTTIFDFMDEPESESYKIKNKIRLIELFAGIGSQAKALERLGADFEHHRVVEFDKYAIRSYNAVHGTNFETSDVTKIHAADLGITDTDKFTYIMTYSFPCQDLSIAGRGKGMEKGSGTRSGLLWEVERILNECTELPQILLMENVPQVHGNKNMDDFEKWIEFLEAKGYSNYWHDLNAKDFGIPQNRDRCFMVSLLGNFSFEFPKPIKLELRLKDSLEDKVDKRFYLSEQHYKNLSIKNAQQDSRSGVKQIGNCMKSGNRDNPNQGRIYDTDGLSPTLGCMQGGGRQPFIIDDIYNNRPKRFYEEYAPTLRAERQGLKVAEKGSLFIRKLTPSECWRLMGFDDEDFRKAEQINSNNQLYKQAGNSIVVNVLEAIFRQLL